MSQDFGQPCGSNQKCTLHNLHCGYPNCYKGRNERKTTMRPDEITDAEVDALIAEGQNDDSWGENIDPRLERDRQIVIAALQHFKATRNQPSYREWMLRMENAICKAITTTLFSDEHRNGRATCDAEKLLKHFNAIKPKYDAILVEAGERQS